MTIQDITADYLMTGKNVKVFDGIAGAAKTSTLVNVLRAAGIDYVHTTSTNKLKRDIEKRFGGTAQTVASELFHTEDGVFYKDQKDTPAKVIIIDEILQVSPKIFEWIRAHADNKKIFVCTDSKQMLAPVTGESNLRKFFDLCNSDIVDYQKLTYSYRPVNNDTRKIYDYAYRRKSEYFDLYKYVTDHCDIVEVPEYDPANAYLVHSNDIEGEMYDEWGLRENYENELIPKGLIANKDIVDKKRYPIKPQNEITNNHDQYYQVNNVGSVVRYQGSEVADGHTLYYCINPNSKPTNREIYTAITRAKNFNDFKIVFWEARKDITLVSFNGLPIIKKDYVVLNNQNDYIIKDKDGKEIKATKKEELTNADIFEIRKQAQANDPGHYYAGVIKNGAVVKPGQQAAPVKHQISIQSIIRKEPRLALKYPGLFFSEIDKYNVVPHNTVCLHNGANGSKQKKECKYGLDLYSAYSSTWYNEGMIDSTSYTPKQNKQCKLYIVIDDACNLFEKGTIITQPLYDYVSKLTWMSSFVCIGSCDYIKNDRIGQLLWEKINKSKEDKKEVSSIHWGFLQKKYLTGVNLHNGWNIEGFYISSNNVYELTMIHLQSNLTLQMLKIQDALDLDYMDCHPFTDCLYFNIANDCDIINLAKKIELVIPNYKFRIFANDPKCTITSDQKVLYQNYENLKTREEIRKEQRKAKRREKHI